MKGLALAAVICLGMTGAIATAASPENEVRFDKLDADGDGRLSRKEVAAYPELVQRFEQIDSNKDGFLSRDELVSKRRGMCG